MTLSYEQKKEEILKLVDEKSRELGSLEIFDLLQSNDKTRIILGNEKLVLNELIEVINDLIEEGTLGNGDYLRLRSEIDPEIEESIKNSNDKLHKHFNSLAKNSDEVFALEHNLEEEELENIKLHINNVVFPIKVYWLLWVIKTTESGYEFSKDNRFWWRLKDHFTAGLVTETTARNRIRECFERFHEEYKGVIPTGRWADAFRIISWPVTHAIIPSYLQEQLANEILRISTSQDLNQTHFSSAKELGQFYRDNYTESGHQFDTIMNHPEIIGALILRITGSEASPPIYEPTFDRIIESFRETVKNFEHIGSETKRNLDIARRRARSLATGSSTPMGRNTLEGVSLKPFIVYENNQNNEEWAIKIRLPRIRNPEFSTIRKDLLNNDLRLNFAKEWSLYSGELAYAHPDRKFDFNDADLDLSRSLIEYSNGETPKEISDRYTVKSVFGEFPWIFKLNKEENRGEIIFSGWLRGSTKYLYVSDVEIEEPELFKSIPLSSQTLRAYEIELNNDIDERIIEILKKYNLGINDGIVIEPLGNSVVDFHEENISIQEGDPLILRLFSNQALTGVILTLSDDNDKEIEKLELPKLNHNEDCLIDLNERLSGVYHIKLDYSDEFQAGLSFKFELTVKPREIWQGGNNDHSLFAELKKSGRGLPLIPSLDEIFDKQVEFFINKPSSSLVNIELELFDHDQTLERLEIPVIEDRFETRDWEEKALSQMQKFDVNKATNLKVTINGFEHGYYIFDCWKRGSTSFYWSYEEQKLYLNDENGELEEPRVSFRSPTDPLKKEGGIEMDFDIEKSAFYLDPKESGLYTHQYEGKSANILFLKDDKGEDYIETIPFQEQPRIHTFKRFSIIQSWLNPDRVVCIHPELTQEVIHRKILQRLASNVINDWLISDRRWWLRENKYLNDGHDDQDNLWSYISEELKSFVRNASLMGKKNTSLMGNIRGMSSELEDFKQYLDEGPIKKAIMGGNEPELRICSKSDAGELCDKDEAKIKGLLESIKLPVEIDLNYGVYLDEGKVTVLGKKGFSNDQIEKVIPMLKAHLPDYEIKDYQEKWDSKDILDFSLDTIEDQIGELEKNSFENFYNFSVNPFNQDIFNSTYKLINNEESESTENNFNYRAAGLREDPWHNLNNVFEQQEKVNQFKAKMASIILRYILFKASKGREGQAGKKDIFPGFREI